MYLFKQRQYNSTTFSSQNWLHTNIGNGGSVLVNTSALHADILASIPGGLCSCKNIPSTSLTVSIVTLIHTVLI